MLQPAETVSGRGGLAVLGEILDAEQARWFLWLPVLVGLGIGLYFALPTEPALVAAATPFAGLVILRVVLPKHGYMRLATAMLAAVAAGFATAKVRTELVRGPVLQATTGLVEIHGWIELVEPRVERGQRLTIRVARLANAVEADTPRRVRVRTLDADAILSPGEPVRVQARLNPPGGPVIPGAHDFARQAWFLGIGAVGFAPRAVEREPSLGAAPLDLQFRAGIERVRQAIGQRVTAALPGETGHIANALITGERGGISEQTNAAFRDSGLLHILSISGLHMVIMAGAVFFSLRLVLAAIPALALRFPIKKWAAVGAALAALAYLMISGAAFATVRSYIMISIMFLAVLLDRPAVALRNVALAALLILVLYPESVLDVGFQMSFAAVVCLVAAYEALRERADATGSGPPSAWRRTTFFFGGIILSTLIASLAVAPFAAYHFHKSQQYAILANLIAIPVCNVLVMPAALATLVLMPLGLEAWPLYLMGKGIEAMVWCAEVVAGLPGAVGRIPAMPRIAFIAFIAGGLWLALWRERWRLLGLMPILLGAGLAPFEPRPDLLVGRDGTLVAARLADGRLSFIAPRLATFDVSRWLEHDGDARAPEEVMRAHGFTCDGSGCLARVAGMLIAVPRHPSALGDDCQRADIVVWRGALPRGCQPRLLGIDSRAIARYGAHALYFTRNEGAPPSLRLETVAATRGVRPWSAKRQVALSETATAQ